MQINVISWYVLNYCTAMMSYDTLKYGIYDQFHTWTTLF